MHEEAPSEICRLQGHRHDVLLLQVSHDSSGIATGSKDGCVRVSSRLMGSRNPSYHNNSALIMMWTY